MPKREPDKLERLLLREEGLVLARNKTAVSFELKAVRKKLLDHVQETGRSSDLDLILATERAILQGDLDRYANSGAMATSLKKALLELGVAETLVAKVRDPDAYQAINQGFALPKNRHPQRLENSVPHDEARQFFRSHDMRLVNMDKSRLDDEEKALVEARKRNIRVAEKLYAEHQRKTLGVTAAPGRDHGLSR